MTCKRFPIEPNPRNFKYVGEEYLKNRFTDPTASRWSYDQPEHLNLHRPWPRIDGLDVSALDVISCKIRPHRFQRYSGGWTRVAKQRVCSATWLLHVNANGYHFSDTGLEVGIPTLIVKILNEIDIREFEEVAVYNMCPKLDLDGPQRFMDSGLQHNINIEGRKTFKPVMDKLALTAFSDLNQKEG